MVLLENRNMGNELSGHSLVQVAMWCRTGTSANLALPVLLLPTKCVFQKTGNQVQTFLEVFGWRLNLFMSVDILAYFLSLLL